MSFRNLLPRANSAYVSVTDKSTVTPTYPLTIIQDCTFSPVPFLSGSDVMVTAMVRLIGFVGRIVARLIAHRYIQHQCAYVLFYSNRFPSHFDVLFSMLQQGFWWQ